MPVVSSNNQSTTSATIGGTMGAVILLLMIIVVLCAVVLCMNRTRDVSTTALSNDDAVNYGLYNTIKPMELDIITNKNNVPSD